MVILQNWLQFCKAGNRLVEAIFMLRQIITIIIMPYRVLQDRPRKFLCIGVTGPYLSGT